MFPHRLPELRADASEQTGKWPGGDDLHDTPLYNSTMPSHIADGKGQTALLKHCVMRAESPR